MLRIAVCDDNLKYLDEVKALIKKWSDVRNKTVEISVFDNGDSLIERQANYPSDIIFLDIMMPLLSGMDTAKEIRTTDKDVKIVFLTSSPEFAIESYDVKASGYLLKPAKQEKIYKMLDECSDILMNEPESTIIKTSFGYHKIFFNKIEYIEAQNRKVVFLLKDGTAVEALDTFSNYAEIFTPEKGFFKCHRSYIVSIADVDTFNSTEITTKSGIRIPIARGLGKDFKETYFTYMFKNEDKEV